MDQITATSTIFFFSCIYTSAHYGGRNGIAFRRGAGDSQRLAIEFQQQEEFSGTNNLIVRFICKRGEDKRSKGTDLQIPGERLQLFNAVFF